MSKYRLTPVAAVAAAAAVVCALGGCTADRSPRPQDGSVSGEITVFAAASLTASFGELAEEFERQNPGTTVQLSFAGSSDLVTQLTQGAPADVFASADAVNMGKAVDGELVRGEPADFAKNTLTIVTAPGNPKNVTSFGDLANPDILTVVCAPQVPCGSATDKVEDATGTTIPAVSEESAVTDVLGKVTSGQADAGIVYVTDAATAGDRVTSVPFPESSNAANTYPIAVLQSSRNPATADAFADLVTGEAGRAVLARAGFAAP
ncbi:MAG: molybdate ABC transporter substrate-binding protein [Rhodococcus sp. (in: high G+C Gram-positive bacteria)]